MESLIAVAFGVGAILVGLIAYRVGWFNGHNEGFLEGRSFQRHIEKVCKEISQRNKK